MSAGLLQIAASVRSGRISAAAVAEEALNAIAARNPAINAFTAVLRDRALAKARDIDAAVAAGGDPGPMAGVPFAAKNLFDVQGLVTLSGSKINADNPVAVRDAWAVRRLESEGAVLVGALNMDEYAYGFTTENHHYGPTRNPHDTGRVAGGSSGGSAAAVAAGILPLTLGSDTNGSVRVPASFCGIFGLKPTYGRLSRSGMELFSASLDHAGLFARSVIDLAAAYDTLQGLDSDDPAQADEPVAPTSYDLEAGAGLRIARLGGYFAGPLEPEASAACEMVANALGVTRTVELPEAKRARAAAFVITASEGGNLHLPDLKKRMDDFDPATRDRFLAGAMVPATWYIQAQRFRRWYREQAMKVFGDFDVLIAPAAPLTAPRIGQSRMIIAGQEMPTRANLGMYTQPISFIGLPVATVPCWPDGCSLPVGIQIIAAPFKEAQALQVAYRLERMGVVAAPVGACAA